MKPIIVCVTIGMLWFTSLANADTCLVITNNTGLPDDAVYVTLQGQTITGNYSGGNLALNNSYSLAQLYGTVPGASGAGPVGTQRTLTINTLGTIGGQMIVTLGSPIGSGTPASNIVQGLFEAYIDPTSNSGHQNNVDISYVSNISLPMSMSIRARAGGGLVPLTNQQNQVNTTPGATIFNNLTASTTISPLSARISAGGYNVVNTGNAVVGQMNGIATVVASQTNPDYHSWLTPNTGNATTTALIPWLRSQNITLNVASYQVPVGPPPLAGTLYGFGGNGATGPFAPTVNGTALWHNGQSYVLTAQFLSDLNPGNANPRISGNGIVAGTPGVRISGYGGVSGNMTASNVGNFDIYISDAQLNLPTSIYGANPTYVLDWTGHLTANATADPISISTTDSNSMADRAVGDLMSGLTLGWAASSTQIDTHAASTGTSSNLVGSLFEGDTRQIGQISTGELFYLLSLQQSWPQVALWTGSGVQTNPLFYDTYGNAFQANTDAYAYAYSDRLSTLSPDVYYYPNDFTVAQDDLYISLVLSPGGYSFDPVPEPASLALLGFGSLALLYRRRKPVG